MSTLDHLLEGSLIGKERLMHAREFYTPSRAALLPEHAFTHWTHRIAVQNEIGSAREMAGLADAQLDVLEGEFIRCPMRPRSAWTRHGLRVGALCVGLACITFAVGDLAGMGAVATRAMTVVGAALVLAGLGSIAVGGLRAFSAMHLDLNYGTTGLYVGRLDEQHPWLYKTMGLLRHEAAETYRQTVLRERGSLRGLDYVMMRELVAAHDALDRLRPASTVAEQLRTCPELIEAPAAEPRLVQVSSGAHVVLSTAPERPAVNARAA